MFYYITFGATHLDGGLKKYSLVETENEELARMIAFEVYGRKWSMIYDSREKAGVEEFGLKLHEILFIGRKPGGERWKV